MSREIPPDPPPLPDNPVARHCLEMALGTPQFRRAVEGLVRRCPSLPADAADDVVQEVAERALRKAAEYDPAASRPIAWLMGFAHRVIHERRRFSDRRSRKELSYSEGWWEHLTDRLQEAPDSADGPPPVLRALEAVPELRKRAIRLRILDGLQYPLVAERLNTTVAGARALVCRGLDDLRRHFPPEEV